MTPQAGKCYKTAKGRVVGPLLKSVILGATVFIFDDYWEPGLWMYDGRCAYKESKTAWSYGNLVEEVV